MKLAPLLATALLAASNAAPIDVHLIGDSTMAERTNLAATPERGWGQMLQQFFDGQVVVHNHAVNGRSTKSFIDEGKWAAVVKELKAGDYVFIEFGHNDEKIEDSTRYAEPHSAYKTNLQRFVNEARAKGALPILFTPIARRKFDGKGQLRETHGDYPGVVREVATAMNVPFIDLGALTHDLVQPFGPEDSKRLYAWTDGHTDDTHLSAFGATEVAKLAAGAVAKLGLPLGAHVHTEPTPIPLREGDTSATITPFLLPAGVEAKSAAVIFPGGGYEHLATEKEGNATARWLNANGVAAFVVKYRLGPTNHHPAMLDDAKAAIGFVRAKATRYAVNPGRVGIVGFSAGGHLASTLGTHFDRATRPDFMILVYPVITMDSTYTHKGSRMNLLGDHPSPALVRLLSNETQVTADTPPTFIVATTDDATVPVRNSLAFYDALRAAKVPAELHVFEHGRHGFGLAPDDPVLSTWTLLAAQWLASHDWATAPQKSLTKPQ